MKGTKKASVPPGPILGARPGGSVRKWASDDWVTYVTWLDLVWGSPHGRRRK